MKTLCTSFIMIIMYVSVQSQTAPFIMKQKDPANNIQHSSTAQSLSSGNWFTEAREQIRTKEYAIQWKNSLQQHVAVNRNNRLGFFFDARGYRILSFTAKEQDNWEYNFRVNGIRRGSNNLDITTAPAVMASSKKLTYHYPGFEIEYLNDSLGMRQNFIVQQKPTGTGAVEVAIELNGDLIAGMQTAGRLTLSSNTNGIQSVKMIYDGLKAWDANHQPVEATMHLEDNGKQLIISVNDANAIYPITIDPLNHTPNWSDNGQGVLPALDVLYGSSVSDAGDVNNDGYDDIIIGAPANIDILSNSVIASVGQAFIYLGSATGPAASPSITLQSSTTINALFGYCVSSAGDINNDGFDDVIVGAPADQVSLNFGFPFGSVSNRVGAVYIYYGNSTTASIAASAITVHLKTGDFNPLTFGLTINPLYGFSVSSAGDVNNDGYSDVVVGSPLYTDLGTLTLAGRASIYLGSDTGLKTASPIHRNAGLLANSLFGFSVSSAGDMNNDGADEVLIGAPGSLSLLPGLTGRVYVYQGIAVPTTGGISASATTFSDGALLKTLFGYSVSDAGDVNNDGFDDIIVGQPATLNLAGLVSVGRASIFYGSATLTNKSSSDVILRSPRDPDIIGLLNGNLLFGFSVSGGRDLDCDGYDDVLVGEPGGTALNGLAGINAAGGQAYIYYGKNGAGPSSTRGWEQKQTGAIVVANLLGSSVSSAGDVDGDGGNDLLIGAANGTLDLSNLLTGILNFTFVQSVGSAYVHFGCIQPTIFTLPLNISYFAGQVNNSEVLLKWQTASEQNLGHFEIERSANGSAFEKIGTITANGNSNTALTYYFTDKRPLAGTNSYRLKSTDKDGKFVYSNIITVRFKAGSGSIHAISERSNEVKLRLDNISTGSYNIELLAMNGTLIQRTKINLAVSNGIISFSCPSLSKGIYVLKAQQSGGTGYYYDKLIIQ